MTHPRRNISSLTMDDIRAWCEEWEIAGSDFQLLLEAYAEGEDELSVAMFMLDITRAKRIQLHCEGQLFYLEDFLASEAFDGRVSEPEEKS